LFNVSTHCFSKAKGYTLDYWDSITFSGTEVSLWNQPTSLAVYRRQTVRSVSLEKKYSVLD
jgi:hypothetical protein